MKHQYMVERQDVAGRGHSDRTRVDNMLYACRAYDWAPLDLAGLAYSVVRNGFSVSLGLHLT